MDIKEKFLNALEDYKAFLLELYAPDDYEASVRGAAFIEGFVAAADNEEFSQWVSDLICYVKEADEYEPQEQNIKEGE
ncbi:hypothetical protein QUQ16_000179 [Escherichia coli]|nr:hypothetical protein [Escherichia coli]